MHTQRNPLYACIGAVTAAVVVASSAMAANSDAPDLSTWNYGDVRDGWTASKIIDAEVRGTDGEQLGEIHNLVLGSDGQLKSAIVESGGFLDVGDNHFRVPWSEVDMAPDRDYLAVPISADNVDAYTVFDGEKLDRKLAENSYRATELVRTFVALDNREAYGIVTDLVFSRKGQLSAVIAQPTAGYSGQDAYAFPYVQNAYDRASGTWEFPYTDEDVKVLKSFKPANLY